MMIIRLFEPIPYNNWNILEVPHYSFWKSKIHYCCYGKYRKQVCCLPTWHLVSLTLGLGRRKYVGRKKSCFQTWHFVPSIVVGTWSLGKSSKKMYEWWKWQVVCPIGQIFDYNGFGKLCFSKFCLDHRKYEGTKADLTCHFVPSQELLEIEIPVIE